MVPSQLFLQFGILLCWIDFVLHVTINLGHISIEVRYHEYLSSELYDEQN